MIYSHFILSADYACLDPDYSGYHKNLFKLWSIIVYSFECRKVIGFTITTLRDWLKRFAPLFHPITSKTKTNYDALACIFPRFASATSSFDWFTVLSVFFVIG